MPRRHHALLRILLARLLPGRGALFEHVRRDLADQRWFGLQHEAQTRLARDASRIWHSKCNRLLMTR